MTLPRLVMSGSAALLLAIPLLCHAESRVDQREDFVMDSISGGEFRDYISTHITEQDAWAHSMRTFGSFHNFMHEMMSAMARHGAYERGDEDKVPAFEHRISGGGWGEYREALEAVDEAENAAWLELVQVTEIMHDRVHHAMARSLLYDIAANRRDVAPTQYLRDEPLPVGAGIAQAGQRNLTLMSLDAFRTLAWSYDTEGAFEHAALQQMVVFAHMLDDLLAQWLAVGAKHGSVACRPAGGIGDLRGLGWPEYVRHIGDCADDDWRELVQVVGLMQDRIHHMLYKMARYQQQ